MPSVALALEPISTDRPDFVESSLVVGSGMVQIETSVLNEHGHGINIWSTPTLLRIGINDRVEMRFESDGFVSQQNRAFPAFNETDVADASIGIKWHQLDAGEGANWVPSLAWLVHLDIPTGGAAYRGEAVIPSVRWVAEWEIDENWSFGAMPGFSWSTDSEGHREPRGVLGLVLGRQLTTNTRGLVELFAPEINLNGTSETPVSLKAGWAWTPNPDLQFDTALSSGLNDDAPDTSVTIGLSKRFR